MNEPSHYRVTIPATGKMPEFAAVVQESGFEPKELNALWEYNDARDGHTLPHLDELPAGTVFTPVQRE